MENADSIEKTAEFLTHKYVSNAPPSSANFELSNQSYSQVKLAPVHLIDEISSLYVEVNNLFNIGIGALFFSVGLFFSFLTIEKTTANYNFYDYRAVISFCFFTFSIFFIVMAHLKNKKVKCKIANVHGVDP